jgi:hypothetical protein
VLLQISNSRFTAVGFDERIQCFVGYVDMTFLNTTVFLRLWYEILLSNGYFLLSNVACPKIEIKNKIISK